MGPKIRFYGELCLIIPKLSLLPLFIWSTDVCLNLPELDSNTGSNQIIKNLNHFLLYLFALFFSFLNFIILQHMNLWEIGLISLLT